MTHLPGANPGAPRAPKGRPSAAWLALAAVLLAYLGFTASRELPNHLALDLYHPWGIAAARDARPPTPGNPYANTQRFGAALNAIAAAGSSAKAKVIADIRGDDIQPTGTPLFYAALGFLPHDFDHARALLAALQYLCLGTSAYLLARMRNVAVVPSVCLAVLVAATYTPFAEDVRLGNVNSLQLLFVVALLHLAVNKRYLANRPLEYGVIAAVVAFGLFKPNTLLILCAFALHYGLVRGAQRVAVGAAVAAFSAILSAAVGAAYFGDIGVWQDWYRYTQGANGGKLLYTLEEGNWSLATLMAQRSAAYGPIGYGALLAATFVLAFVAAATAMGRKPELLRPMAARAFSNPWFAASFGVILTFAASPLLWAHYFVFALVPIAMLIRSSGRWDLPTACALASYFAFFRPLVPALLSLKMGGVVYAILIFNWVPLVAALLAYVVRQRKELDATLASRTSA